jgi:hypothetical protein
MYKNDIYKTFLEENNFIITLLSYLENIQNHQSIILIRELEIIISYLNILDEKAKNYPLVFDYLKKLSSKFYSYDLLTQLTFLDVLEKTIQKEIIITSMLKEMNIFQQLEVLNDQILRKFFYTLSKFYAMRMLNDKNNFKNLLSVSIQYFNDNKNEKYFIISVINNCFHNRDIFSFLMDSDNNIQFNFCENVIDVLVQHYYDHDPKIKSSILETISIIGNFSIPSLIQEQFMKRFLIYFYRYYNNKSPSNDNEMYQFFIQRLYKDFKTHDFEEYELQFLDTILSKISMLI